MRIVRFTYAPYDLPLVRPWQTAKGTFTSRYGCLVCLHSRRGEIGIGEMAPLAIPDVKTEAELSHTLERLSNTEYWPRLKLNLAGFDEWCVQSGIALERFPDLTFAVQSALGGLWSVRYHLPLRKLMSPSALNQLDVNAAIPASDSEAMKTAADEAVANGFRTLKIKIGVHSVEEDIELIARLRAAYPDIKLRVDANGAWTFREARQFLRAALALNIEYVEDPLKVASATSLKVLTGRVYARIGLDDVAANEAHPCCYRIIKPARFASLSTIRQAALTNESNGAQTIMTGSFESSVGLSYVATCAAAFGSTTLAHGLATASWLAEDTLTEPLTPQQGMIRVPDISDLPRYLLPRYKDELGIAA